MVLYAKDVLTDLVTVHNPHSGQPRWQYCTQVSSMLFGEELSRLYMSSQSSAKRRKITEDVEDIFGLIRRHVLSNLDRAEWLQPGLRAEAKAKIESLRGDFIGSEAVYFNRSLIAARYRGAEVMKSGDFFANVINMFAHFRANLYHLIDEKVDEKLYTWNLVSFPFTVNAFHLQQLNSIVIPLGEV